nr:MAG: hypothetical protein [Porcellio scaber clopovirus]
MKYTNIIDLFLSKNPFPESDKYHICDSQYFNVYFNTEKNSQLPKNSSPSSNMNIVIAIPPPYSKTKYFLENREIKILKKCL